MFLLYKKVLDKSGPEQALIELFISQQETIEGSLSATILARFSYVFKNPTFSDEEEWRLVYLPLITQQRNNPRYINDRDVNVQFRVSGNNILEYTIHEFSNQFSSKLIPKIVLGPRCPVSHDTIGFFLSKQKLYDTEILRSVSSYR